MSKNLLILITGITLLFLHSALNQQAFTAETANRDEVIKIITASEENEQRTYPRYENKRLKKPVVIERDNSGIIGIVNISRGGIAIRHNNSLQTDDIIPLHLIYEDISIQTNARVVFSKNGIAGAEFLINGDKDTFNKLLYLSIRIEADNGMLVTKLSDG